MTDSQQIEMFPTVLRLGRTDLEGIVRCFYIVTVQPDLFDAAALPAEFGRASFPEPITT